MKEDIEVHTTSNKIMKFITNFFGGYSNHVNISPAGMIVLRNNKLARKVVHAVIESKEELENGNPVTVEDGSVSVTITVSNEDTANLNSK